MMTKNSRTVLALILAVAAGTLSPLGGRPADPRLILTPERIAALKAGVTTTHRELWIPALESAEQFSRQTIPPMTDANNRLRTLGDTMPVLGLAYHLTGERRFAEAADRWLTAMIAVPEWKGSQNLGRCAWVMGSSLLYDWLRDALPADTRARVRKRLVAEGEILLVESSYWRLLSNHCLIEAAALGLMGLALQGEHDRASAFLEKARERTELIIEHAPLDGTWGEGVQYWQYGLGYLLRFLEASKTAGDRDYYPRYEWLKKTGFFPIHLSEPGRPRQTVNFADSGMNDYMAEFLFTLPASIYRNGYFQDFARKTRGSKPYKFSWMDFIAYDPTVKPIDFTTLPKFTHFEDNGFVIMRSGWEKGATLVAFHAGPGPGHRNQRDPRRLERRGFGPGHAHPDINGFSLFAYDQWLVLDPGYVHQKWTRDENTILVNGHGQAGEGKVWLDYMAFQNREPAPSILRAETHPDFDYVIGDAGNVYVDEAALAHFRRHLLFLKPDIVVVLDDIAATKPSQVEWLLQAHSHAAQTGPNRFEIAREGVRLSIQPLVPHALRATITRRDIRAAATAGKLTTLNLTANDVTRTEFLVVLCALPDSKARAPAVEFDNDRLRIQREGRSWTVEVKDPLRSADPAAPLLTPVRS